MALTLLDTASWHQDEMDRIETTTGRIVVRTDAPGSHTAGDCKGATDKADLMRSPPSHLPKGDGGGTLGGRSS